MNHPSVILAGAILALSNSAHAEHRLHAALGSGAQSLPMKSVDALSENNGAFRVSMEAGASLPFPVFGGSGSVSLRWSSSSLSGTTFQTVDSELDLSTVQLVGRYSRPLLAPYVHVFVEGGMGSQHGELTLEDQGRQSPLAASDRAFVMSGALGADLSLHEGKDAGFGIRVRVGYEAVTSFSFEGGLMRPNSDAINIDSNSTQFGSINTSGLDASIALYSSFL